MLRSLTRYISTPLKAALVYVVLAATWILFSDRLLLLVSQDPQVLSRMQTAKGWLFVVTTGLFVGLLASRSRRREQQAVRELARSEARFRSLVQNSSDMVRMVDANGVITFESPAIRQILGYEPSEVEGKSVMAFVHPEDLPVRERFEKETTGGHGRATYRVRHKSGEWRWIESAGVNLLDDPEVGAIVINSRDVTESKAVEEALREEQEFVESLLEATPGIFYLFDEDGRYVRWNENLLQVTGYEESELENLSPLDVVVPEERERTKELMAQVLAGASATAVLTVLTKSGERIPYLCTGMRVTLGGKIYLAGVGLDHSEQHEARAKIDALNSDLEERLERLDTLQEIDRAISGSLELPLVLSVFLDGARYRLKVDAAAVLLHEPDAQMLTFSASKGFKTRALHGARLRLGEGPAGRAALTQRMVQLEGDEIVREIVGSDELAKEEFAHYWAVPLIAKGRVQGVLELFCRDGCHKDEDWYEFLEAMATQAAIAIDNAMLFQQQSRANEELTLAYDTTIEGWARALDLRDRETEGHSRRVTELTTTLARKLDFPSDELVFLRWGALLHDIGKMAVPDSILLKKGKLATDEWELMKAHPEHAFKLLSPITFLRPALDIPYAHHERWDGKGYPLGLKEAEIPLPARIFAVVDVFDALTSVRPYRPAWPREKALEYIRAQRGRQFDPQVVDAFLEVMAQESEMA
ncbi:MAG TPA: HD domain-containing phosphohydrolase [Trueperaceae bacterium]